jgi:hypothetical protein
LEKRRDQQTGTESKKQLVDQINACLHSGDYSRALELLRDAPAEFSDDAELSRLEKLAQAGVNTEANRLITESQELFAQQKSAEAIQLLREAYELDKNNALARTILANVLVEQAHSIVESDWREAEALAKQALELNPAHPTAKTIRGLIIDRKKASSVEEWATQIRKLQSAGYLSAALSLIAEGMAFYPHHPKLLQIQDEIERDQAARRRQARRRDLDDLRRTDAEIDGLADVASKKALVERIQALKARYSTDGEILSVANALLHRLESLELPRKSATASPDNEGVSVIPPASPPAARKPSGVDAGPVPPNSSLPIPVPPSPLSPSKAPPSPTPPESVPAAIAPPSKVPPSVVVSDKPPASPPEQPLPAPQAATVAAFETPTPAAEVASPPSQPARSNFTTLLLFAAAAIVLVAATFFFTRKHYAPPVAQNSAAAPNVSTPAGSAPASAPTVSAPAIATPVPTTPAQATPAPSPPDSRSSSAAAGKVTVKDQPPAESGHNLGTLLVVAGQDGAKVFLDGQLQPQLTQGGQLRLPNLELKDYVVQVSRSGFQDPPPQKVHIGKGEQARLVFNLQPQPHLASLSIQGGAPETAVLVDQNPVGTIPPDGALSIATITPGDHTVELRKERFKPRQFKKHFVAGETTSLSAADASLEAAPGELKITFAPADATVAVVKGDLLKVVSSGVPLNLPAGTYTLTARTAERFTRSSTVEVIAGQSKALDLSLAPSGMSKWDDPGAWKQEKDSFIRKGGDFVLYGVAPSGTFAFSAMLAKGHLLQWVLNYSDPKNYVLFQMDDNNFYRAVVRNGVKTDEIKVPDNGDKKSFRTFQIRVSSTEIAHQIKHGDHWTVLDRCAQPGANLSLGKFGFYIPGSDQVALSSFAHYVDLNIR